MSCAWQPAVDRPPIPALLAIGAVHHHLIRTGLRTETSIVADTAQCVSTHQLAVMVGYGAHAVCPYLGFETARQWRTASRCVVFASLVQMCLFVFYQDRHVDEASAGRHLQRPLLTVQRIILCCDHDAMMHLLADTC